MSFGISYVSGDKDKSKSISGERYVYYKRLLTDNNGSLAGLYYKAKDVLDYRIEEGASTEKISKYFFSLRDNEYKKEVELLSKTYGKKITSTYKDGSATGEELINAFNTTLNLKEVFERNLALIKETEGQRQLIISFYSYFNKEWEKESKNIINDIIKSYKETDDISKAIKITITNAVPELTRKALLYMFTEARAESGIKTDPARLKNAYQELAKPLRDMSNNLGNEFIASFVKAYELDKIEDRIIDSLEDIIELPKNINNFKCEKYVNMYTTGGLAAENLGAYIAGVINKNFNKKGNNFKSTQTGFTKQKADMIYTVGLPSNLITDWMEENVFGTRRKNVDAVQKLQQSLRQFDEGFIIYSNAKSYTLNKNFRGFSAGSSIDLNSWDDMMHAINKKGRDLIFSVMQTIPGAIGEGREEEVNRMFARAISSALFDDFDVVGKEETTSPKSIHILYLNGIYFPMSFYYDLLGKSFEEYNKQEAERLIKVGIKRPEKIKFDSLEEEATYRQETGGSTWGAQQRDAMKETTISYHFLRGFKEIMKNIKFKN